MNILKFIMWSTLSILFASVVLQATGNAGLATSAGILMSSAQFIPMPSGILGEGAPGTRKTKEEEAREEIENLGKDLNEKLEKHETKLKELGDTMDEVSEKGEGFDKLKDEFSEFSEKHEGTFEEYKSFMESAQKHMDDLDLKIQKGGDNADKSFGGYIKELVEDNIEMLEKVGTQELGAHMMEIKADRTLANGFTGEVIDRDRIPGIFWDPDRDVHIRDFMNITPTTTDVIRFNKETEYNDAADTRAEGVASGQTDFKLESQDETIRKIVTHLTISKEMMNDAPFIMNYIQTRVMGKIMVKEDDQILYGSGVSPNLNGLTLQAQAYTDLLDDSNAQRIDVITNAITNTMQDEYRATLALVSVEDFQRIILTKDADGNYLLPHVFSGQPLIINGARVIGNTSVTDDDLLVGDFRLGATLALRSGIEMTFANQHSDNFTKGFVTIQVEERVGMPVYRPNAFVFTDFTTALGDATG